MTRKKKASLSDQDRPGIPFEKAVAEVQSQMDPKSVVTHNEFIVDRLNHRRQFDVVIRGTFGGQPLLGVVECKDLSKKVGTPEIDAFITKSQDINANLRIMMSRRGFTDPALEKCAHYGIQALSLLGYDPPRLKLFLGARWEADVYHWRQIAVTLRFVTEPSEPVHFKADELTIDGKRVLEWYTNYILRNEANTREVGWLLGVGVEFEKPQSIHIAEGISHLCRAIEFIAERACDRYERLVGVSGTGFYNWNSGQASFPEGSTIQTDFVPIDFRDWSVRSDSTTSQSRFMTVRLVAQRAQFDLTEGAIDLELL